MNAENAFHIPVLATTVCELLITNPGGIYVDGTLGGGGHAEAVLNRLDKSGVLIGIDQDQDAIDFASKRLAPFQKQVRIVKQNFGEISEILNTLNIKTVDGFFLDLGVSSFQLDESRRGFSYLSSVKLDMRMSSENSLTAIDILNAYDEEDLANLFYRYGEERLSRKIARRIVRRRKQNPIIFSDELRQIVSSAVPYKQQIKSLSRVFQALRIEVNQELVNLEKFLAQIIPYLKPKGRIVIIAYHSLEDRIVKHFFKQKSGHCICPPHLPQCICNAKRQLNIITRKVIKPGAEEIRANPRASSARLRAAEKIV